MKTDTEELSKWKIMMCSRIECVECTELNNGQKISDGAPCPGRYAVI